MKVRGFIIAICVGLCLFSSCGIITKTRYGNGFKVNIEFNASRKENKNAAEPGHRPVGKTAGQINEIEKTEPQTEEEVISTDEPVKETLEDISTANGAEHIIKAGKIKRNKKIPVSRPFKQDYDERPMEPNARWAGILFYGGLLLGSLVPFVGIGVIIGFILALVALRNIRISDYAYKGYGLALSVVIIFSIMVLFTLALLFFLFSLFAI